MTEVSKIILIGHSGWGPVEETYEERLTVSAAEVTYRCHPIKATAENVAHRWRYWTDGPALANAFENLAAVVVDLVNKEVVLSTLDAPELEFLVVYTDRKRQRRSLFCPLSEFKDLKTQLKLLIPQLEQPPRFLA